MGKPPFYTRFQDETLRENRKLALFHFRFQGYKKRATLSAYSSTLEAVICILNTLNQIQAYIVAVS